MDQAHGADQLALLGVGVIPRRRHQPPARGKAQERNKGNERFYPRHKDKSTSPSCTVRAPYFLSFKKLAT